MFIFYKSLWICPQSYCGNNSCILFWTQQSLKYSLCKSNPIAKSLMWNRVHVPVSHTQLISTHMRPMNLMLPLSVKKTLNGPKYSKYKHKWALRKRGNLILFDALTRPLSLLPLQFYTESAFCIHCTQYTGPKFLNQC